MKHGDKKQKTAKAITKASGKKASPPRSSTGDSRSKKAAAPPRGKAGSKPAAVSPKKSGGETTGKRKAAIGPTDLTFSNPLVGAAFKRAVKKYPVALKRLVD